MGPIFTSPTLRQFSKYSNFLEAQSFIDKLKLILYASPEFFITGITIRGDAFDIRSDQLDLMIDNLPPNILKIDLSWCQNLNDLHIEKLVRRCNKITEISLCFTQGNLYKDIYNKTVEPLCSFLSKTLFISIRYINVFFSKVKIFIVGRPKKFEKSPGFFDI